MDAFEPNLQPSFNSGISNLRIYDFFNRFVNVSNYNLLLSICPYCYSHDIYDEGNPEEETKELVTDILDLSIENKIDSFIILASTSSSYDIVEELKYKKKYSVIIQEDISLHYERYGEVKESTNKVLIYKK